MLKAVSGALWSVPNSLTEGGTVVEKTQENKKDVYTEKVDSGRVSGGTFEKFANITQYSCALLGKGGQLSGVLGGAFTIVDGTRFIGDINVFVNGEKSKNGWQLASRVSALFFDGLTTLYTLHVFKIVDFSKIAAGIGAIASYGGVGFIAAIGVVPMIQIGIASYFIFAACSTLIETYKGQITEENRTWNTFFVFLDDYGNKALNPFAKDSQFLQTFGKAIEVSFRIISVTTGTAPVLLPILGLISNAIGGVKVLQDNMEETQNAEELKEKIASEEVENPVEKPTTLAGRAKWMLNAADHTLSSMDGMDKLCKVATTVCKTVSTNLGGLNDCMKDYRTSFAALGLFQWISINCSTKEARTNFLKKTKVEIVAQVVLLAGSLADMGAFVTSANIANLGAYAGKLGECRIFGLTARFSFGQIKATLMSVYIALDLYQLGVKKKWTLKDLERKDWIKIALNIGKLVAIVGSGGFILYAGFGASTAFAIYQIALYSLDAVNWIYNNETKLATKKEYKQK